MELSKIKQEINKLFEDERFDDIIKKLSKSVLEDNNDAELYAMLARAIYAIDKSDDKILVYCQKAIDLDKNYFLPYYVLGNYWSSLSEFDKAIYCFSKSIELKQDDPAIYYAIGVILNLDNNHDKDYEKAITYLNKAIELDEKYEDAYLDRGYAYYFLGQYEKAIEDYNTLIKLNSNNAHAYFGRGASYSSLKNHTKALSDYDKAIEINPEYADAYYNRGSTLRISGDDLDKSIKDYERFLELKADSDDAWVLRAKDILKDLHIKKDDAELDSIIDIISNIKKVLMVTELLITHYTGISTTKKLILFSENKFRISEGTFLNDTSEGTELFKFLDYHSPEIKDDGIIAGLFSPKPFIGSFVTESKHDDLNLWRFYGKENGLEANGCAITLRKNLFIRAIKESFTENNSRLEDNNEDDINFYRVAYLDHNKSKLNFQIPNSTPGTEKKINELMKELKIKVSNYKSKDNAILEKQLNNIAFLFKSDVYKNESELRLVIKGVEFEKKFNLESNPPRVYIELINIRDLVEKITIGPKVEKSDEWAALFYYSYDKEQDDSKKPKKILTSRLPYK